MSQATRRFISPTAEETKHLREEIEFHPNEDEPPLPLQTLPLQKSHVETTPNAVTAPPSQANLESLSIEQLYAAERETNKVNYWRDNYYATGLVEPTWNDELCRMVGRPENAEDDSNGPNRSCCEDVASQEIDPTCGCLICSAFVFSKFGAGRIGNMAVLKESSVMVEVPLDTEEDEENNDGGGLTTDRTKLEHQRKIEIILGPYWPCLIFVTFPLVIGVSLLTAFKAVFIPGQILLVQVFWTLSSVGLLYSLFEVGCRDPGIVHKTRERPSAVLGNRFDEWNWNDKAQSFKPRGAIYDPDCAVVIDQFDHTCPWTGTAIGKKNMWAFQAFVGLVFICLPMDILLLASMTT